MNNKGFAVSTMLYGMLIMASMIMLLLISNMSFRRKTTTEFVDEVELQLNEIAFTDKYDTYCANLLCPTVDVVNPSDGYNMTPSGWYADEEIVIKITSKEKKLALISNFYVTSSDEIVKNTKKTFQGMLTYDYKITGLEGDYKLKFIVDRTTLCDGGQYKIDTADPECGDISEKLGTDDWKTVSDDSKTWRKGDISIRVECRDEGSLCTTPTTDKKYLLADKKTVKTDNIEIVDNSGRKTSCPVNVYVDNEAPSKPVIKNSSNGNLTKEKVKLTITSSDKGSGIANYQYSTDNKNWQKYADSEEKAEFIKEYSEDINTHLYIRVCDKVGNCSEASETDIKIDMTAPAIEYRYLCDFYLPTTNIVNNYVLQIHITDAGSGVARGVYNISHTATKYYDFSYAALSSVLENFALSSDANAEFSISATDAAGNTTSIHSDYDSLKKCDTPIVEYE